MKIDNRSLSKQPDHYQVRSMTRLELDLAVEWADREGWNPGLNDADVFFKTDPQGFMVGCLDGRPIGCISVVSYGNTFGFIGFYIVHPDYRGHGYGIQLWKAAVSRLQGQVIGLDGVVAQQDNYEKSGFKLACNNIRYEGKAVPMATAIKTSPAANVSFEALAAYDRQCFPAERSVFLKAWISAPGTTSLAVINGDGLFGYGAVRPCRTGFKIGPLFADNAAVAEVLLADLITGIPVGNSFFLDVPGTNPAAVSLAEKYGMQPVFETARMYMGEVPRMQKEKMFGITTFELG
ncbi:MAG: GNAT family N-acetyltransferase [Deltaproteobacteria bacterium]|nr:GNAT family N-acetyltransferase [Deltaproteobacteria bacterium]